MEPSCTYDSTLSHIHGEIADWAVLEIQGIRLVRCLVLETSVQIGILGYQSDTKGLDSV